MKVIIQDLQYVENDGVSSQFTSCFKQFECRPTCHYYVKLVTDSQKITTRHISNPIWDGPFELATSSDVSDLTVEVYHYAPTASIDILDGRIQESLDSLMESRNRVVTRNLYKKNSRGAMEKAKVKIQFMLMV